MDDIVIAGDDSQGIGELKLYLQRRFQTKDLGKLCNFLGIKMERSKKRAFSLRSCFCYKWEEKVQVKMEM